MDWLKELLEKVVDEKELSKVVEGIQKEIPKHFATKTDFNNRGAEIKTLKSQLEKTEKQLTSIKDNDNSKVEEYKTNAEEAIKELKEFKAETKHREQIFKMKSQMKDALSKVINSDAVDMAIETFDYENMTLNEDKEIVDMQKKIDRFVESKPGLKIETDINGNPPKDKKTKEDIDYSKMSDKEYYEAMATKE